jgi:hypothetical protein
MCNYCVFTVSKLIVLYVLRFKRELFSYIAVSLVRGKTWLSEPSRGSSSEEECSETWQLSGVRRILVVITVTANSLHPREWMYMSNRN